MPKARLKKLTKTEFFDVYGVSLILTRDVLNSDEQFLVDIVSAIADKYVTITQYAVRAELRYFQRGEFSGEIIDENVEMLRAIGIKNWKTQRTSVSFDNAAILFNQGEWSVGTYGGKAWGQIALAGYKLESLLPVTFKKLKSVLKAIDYLNDLEHNTRLYLDQYSTFALDDALDFKGDATPSEIFHYCSDAVRSIWKENGRNEVL